MERSLVAASPPPIEIMKPTFNSSLDAPQVLGKVLPVKSISVPIGKARTNLCDLVEQAKAGLPVTITIHGRPAAVLGPVPAPPAPWRVEKADDPGRYGDLQKPVLEPWP